MEDKSHNWNTFIAGEYHFATQAREISDEKSNFRLTAFKVKRGTCPLSCQGNFGLEADLRTQCIILAAAWLITSWSLVVDGFVIHWLYWLVYLDSVWFSYIFPESLVFGKFLETFVSTGDVACFHYKQEEKNTGTWEAVDELMMSCVNTGQYWRHWIISTPMFGELKRKKGTR